MTFTRITPVITAGVTMLVVFFSILYLSGTIKSQSLTIGMAAIGRIPTAPPIEKFLIPEGKFGRHRMARMEPKYITIHSTQNYSATADAYAHARALANGALKSRSNSLGYLTWHFSVDEKSIYQSLPVIERGEHADYNGPGNRNSIGIEMCENSGNSRELTIERTAELAAWLMTRYNIPISNVVPHQHWKRIRPGDQRNLGHKNCPHFLMDNGKPGPKWQAFLEQIESKL
ncbi:MAG: N-acetylmuramoyl-L-alanine amidase [Verrucomicrobiales bacterium]|nr:N-acetylmuramoyl-L-alanine amidase [Verrucomicrobiales bacterium]